MPRTIPEYVAMGERALLAVFPDGRLAMSWNARNGGSKEFPVTWHPIPAPDAKKLWPESPVTPDVRVSEQDAEAVAREAVDDIMADLTNTSDRTRWSVIGKMEHEYRAALDAYREAVERRVRAAEVEPCDWYQNSDGLWWTDCGSLFEFNDGGPFLNNIKFCGYCGKKLVEIPYEPLRDDEEEDITGGDDGQ